MTKTSKFSSNRRHNAPHKGQSLPPLPIESQPIWQSPSSGWSLHLGFSRSFGDTGKESCSSDRGKAPQVTSHKSPVTPASTDTHPQTKFAVNLTKNSPATPSNRYTFPTAPANRRIPTFSAASLQRISLPFSSRTPGLPVSNRGSGRLEIAVTSSKQSLDSLSNRESNPGSHAASKEGNEFPGWLPLPSRLFALEGV